MGKQPKLELHCQEDQVNYNQNTNPQIQKHSVFYFSKKNELKAKPLFFSFHAQSHIKSHTSFKKDNMNNSYHLLIISAKHYEKFFI